MQILQENAQRGNINLDLRCILVGIFGIFLMGKFF